MSSPGRRYACGHYAGRPEKLLEDYEKFIIEFLAGRHTPLIDVYFRSFLETGKDLFLARLGADPEPKAHAMARKMLGLGVETRAARARRHLAEAGPPVLDARPPSPPPPPPAIATSSVWRPWEAHKVQKAPPETAPKDPSETPQEPSIKILATSERHLKRFNTTFRQESLQIEGVSRDILDTTKMQSLFQTLLDRQISAVEAAPHDRCILEISSSEHEERPVFLPLRRVDQLAPDVVLHQLVRTLNSNESFLVDGKINVKFIHVPTPLAGGWNHARPCESDESWLKRYDKKSGAIFTPSNLEDSMCLTRSVYIASLFRNLPKREMYKMKNDTHRWQTAGALKLCQMAGLDPQKPCDIDCVKKLQDVLPSHRLCVFLDRRGKKIAFSGPQSTPDLPRTNIYLYWHKEHFHAILKPLAAFGYCYFCSQCLKGYDHIEEHHCPSSCWRCGGGKIHTLSEGENLKECVRCNRYFASEDCFRFHKEAQIHEHGRTTCEVRKFCKECHSPYILHQRGKRKRTVHLCNSFYCRYCKDTVVETPDSPHRCFILKWSEPDLDEKTDYLRCYADIETTQYHIHAGNDSWLEHRANYMVLQVVCSQCEDNSSDDVACPVHGPRTHIFHNLDDPNGRPVSDFLDCLEKLSSSPDKKRKRHLTIWTHNGAGFDHHLFLEEMVKRGKIPTPICAGLRIIGMSYGCWNFKDSCLFLSTKLANLPASYGIEGVKKGDFPFLFNHPENYNYVGEMPDKKYYSTGRMSVNAGKEFEKWYAVQKETKYIFNFRKEIKEYTVNDVRILRLALEKFRTIFIQEGDFDCLHHCLTLGSATLTLFRRNFMPPKSMGIIPRPGYYRGIDTSSQKALEWLTYQESLLPGGLKIQHSENGREVRLLGKYKVDGFLTKPCGEKIVYSYLGCYFHAHPPDQCLIFKNVSQSVTDFKVEKERINRFYQTLRIHDLLRKRGYTVKMKWECHFDSEKKNNPQIKAFFQDHPCAPTPFLNERDALYGGRTETFKTYYKCDLEKGEKIKYVDFQSLYPAVLCYKKYPMGHPDVYVGDDPKCPPLDQVEGLISCTILPPTSLLIPLLPWRAPSGRLMFVLCRSCGEHTAKGECNHTDAERALTGVWGVPEVRKALELGYIILKTNEVWNYKQRSQMNKETGEEGIFSGFMKHMIKKKIECSGWPPGCTTQEEKDAFVKGTLEAVGVLIDSSAVLKNLSMRSLFKLFLNSLWGKLSELPGRNSITLVQTLERLLSLVTDDTLEIQGIIPLTEDTLQVTWKRKNQLQESLPTNSVIHGVYTTMYGRLELYSILEILQSNMLYSDTDSGIYVSRPGEPEPQLGPYLGQLTDEFASEGIGSFCFEFCSAGAKQYCMKVARSGNVDDVKIITRLRGITINQTNSDVIVFEKFKDMAVNSAPPTLINIPSQLARVRGWKIVTRSSSKIWRAVLNKRVVTDNKKDTLPFGYKEIQQDEEDYEALPYLEALLNEQK